MHWALGGVNVGGGDGSGWKVKLKGHVEVEQRALYTAQGRRRRQKTRIQPEEQRQHADT